MHQRSLKKTISSVCNLRLGWRFTFQHDNDPKHTVKTVLEWPRDSEVCWLLEWPIQNSDSNPIEQWSYPKMAVHRHFPSNLTGLRWSARKNGINFQTKSSRCSKLVETYPIRFAAVIAAKGASTHYWRVGILFQINIYEICNYFAETCFHLVNMGYWV